MSSATKLWKTSIPHSILSDHHMNNLYKQGNILYHFSALTLWASHYFCHHSKSLHFCLILNYWCWNFTLLCSALSMVLNQRCMAWAQRLFPQREKKYIWFLLAGWLGGAAWTSSQPGLSVRGKQAGVSAGRELHALFASELSHVIYKGMGGLEAWIHPLDGYKTWLWLGLDGISPV